MARRELCSFRWNGTEWATITTYSNSEFDSKLCTVNQQNTMPAVNEPIRVATLNILADCFPWFIEMAIRSNERFEWLCNGIINLNPTIIGLNEVTINALQQLQQCPFIRENYFITESFDENNIEMKNCTNGLLTPHGSIILSKLPLLEVFAISISGSKRKAVVGKVEIDNNLKTSVYFCANHTTAYQTPKNAQLRAQQIRDIVEILEPLKLPFVIMGDLNLHYQFEDAVVIENKFIDAWAQTHFSHIYPFNDKNEGYTFDTIKNTMIPYYIPGESRQMRLDRILFSNGFPAFAIAPCSMWANEPIKSDNYLFPSDHFGLFIDLVTNVTDINKSTISIGEPDPSVEEILYRNAQNNTDQREYRLGLVRRTSTLVSHLGWLGATALGLK
ncbi:unnamed protein product [Adineta steineri]|uniref:Endonuclease/exonuclease/phosphatase domain-containing protein n=1 Tax=Adineta steineri TaxID=433720 RepID=A0A815SD95_9BILA|nr:unnamed protein product [Adineta steineri]CAF1490429.1 unnamed protein product [Adineta steineri]